MQRTSTIKYMSMKNMPVGTRFIYRSHGSLMIKSDFKFTNLHGTMHLAVSESGLSELISENEPGLMCLKGVKEGVLSLTNSIKKKHFENCKHELIKEIKK